MKKYEISLRDMDFPYRILTKKVAVSISEIKVEQGKKQKIKIFTFHALKYALIELVKEMSKNEK